MLANLNGWHLMIVFAVVLLLFGAARLPALAKSFGQSARVFKGEMSTMKEDDVSPSVALLAADATGGPVDGPDGRSTPVASSAR